MADAADLRLGKQEYSYSEKTLKLGPILKKVDFQPRYDFDKDRAPFKLSMWGNDEWGDCVKCGEANQIMRLERQETRSTAQITEEDVIREYKLECEREFGFQPMVPGDSHDTGLIMRQNLTNWRKLGFKFKTHVFKIAAFGELEPAETDQLRAAIYRLQGVQFGLALPKAAQTMYDSTHKMWDYNGEIGDEWKPGSWGGHAVYSKAYSPIGFQVLSWGDKITVTDNFIRKYCDEAWAVVDDLDSWRVKETINVEGLKSWLQQIGASGMEGL